MKKEKTNPGRNGRNEPELEIFRTEGLVRVRFTKNRGMNKLMKNISGAEWDASGEIWSVKGGKEVVKRITGALSSEEFGIKIALSGPGNRNNSYKNGENGESHCPESFCKKLLINGYSRNTVLAYSSHLSRFIYRFNDRNLALVGSDEIREYVIDMVIDNNYSPVVHSHLVNALRLYFNLEHGRDLPRWTLPRPAAQRQVPVVLNGNEIKRILHAAQDLRQRTMFSLICGTGISLSELLNLRPEDADTRRRLLFVRKNRPRFVPLPPELAMEVQAYKRTCMPVKFLFESKKGGPCSPRTIQGIFKRALKNSGVEKNANIQTLRHCYAMQMLRSGTDLCQVRKLMGHRSPRTAEIYVQTRLQI